MVNSYGAGAQKGFSTFSASITGTTKAKEFGEVGDSLRELRVAINSTVAPEKKGIFGLFQKGKQKVTYVIANYENAETSIKKIEKDLKRHQQVLTKDIYIFEQMYDMNLQFYKELTMYIIAGKKALEIARNTQLVELRDKAEETQDQLDIQLYRDYEDACQRFEKRIFDLETTRLVSIQMAPQIRLLQNADQEVVNKLRSDIINTIPLWRNQMVLALGIEHTTRALNAQSALDEMTNEMFRRNAETLNEYRMPEPHRSTIDYRMYLSNGYIVFNPDNRYRDGYPGESCYNCVMPGIQAVLSRGYVDEKRIGAQGHSWGGYQVAYLATRTRLFAAIESGAPVVNMFSAYGGIRWGSGLARSFQYEHTQSRLGATPWSDPRRYYENSPLFLMDKVETPILIMHNDQDGHVPWYQGIEYFVALKRLGKPAWMLNYTGEPHWPTKTPNKLDFQIRMKQFFDHFLKGEPMPKWMKEGVPAVKQPYELGY